MTYLERMTRDLKIYKPLRTYFDAGSHQFNQTNYEEKISTLGRIVTSEKYELEKAIRLYKKNYSGEGYRHVYGNVKNTLIGFSSYLNIGEYIDSEIIMELEPKSEKEVISVFIKKLRQQVHNSNVGSH